MCISGIHLVFCPEHISNLICLLGLQKRQQDQPGSQAQGSSHGKHRDQKELFQHKSGQPLECTSRECERNKLADNVQECLRQI